MPRIFLLGTRTLLLFTLWMSVLLLDERIPFAHAHAETLLTEQCIEAFTKSGLALSDEKRLEICKEIRTEESIQAIPLIAKPSAATDPSSFSYLNRISSKAALECLKAFVFHGYTIGNTLIGNKLQICGTINNTQALETVKILTSSRKFFSYDLLLQALTINNPHGLKTLKNFLADGRQLRTEIIQESRKISSETEAQIAEILIQSQAPLSDHSKIRNFYKKKGVDDTSTLYIAAAFGNLALVKEMISRGTNINHWAPEGLTPIMIAAKNGHIEIVKLLLENKAKVNDVDLQYGLTPLLFAHKRNYSEIVELLLKSGQLHLNHEIALALEFGEKQLTEKLKNLLTPSTSPSEQVCQPIQPELKTLLSYPLLRAWDQIKSWGYLSPKKIQAAFSDLDSISEEFFHKGTVNWSFTDVRGKSVKKQVTIDNPALRRKAQKQGKIIEPCDIPALPDNKDYNYVVLASGEIICGLVENSWELGVRHRMLANGRAALFGGEINTTKDSLALNVESGTYTRKQVEKLKDEEAVGLISNLTEKLLTLLKGTSHSNRKLYATKSSVQRSRPTLEDVKTYCQDEYFESLNPTLCSKL